MPRKSGDALQGTLTLLVLKTLSTRGPLHGYGIAVHIEERSKDFLRVEEGSLYPALHRLEQENLVKAEWAMTETGRRARVYSITETGTAQLSTEEEYWRQLTRAVDRVLRFASEVA
jgi:PadR family transcriptional regulator, regulatory protein PadR